MKKSSVAAFVLATIVLCFQVVHFSYLKFFNPHESVLSDYLDKQIQQAESLEELVAEYEKSLQAIELYEQLVATIVPNGIPNIRLSVNNLGNMVLNWSGVSL